MCNKHEFLKKEDYYEDRPVGTKAKSNKTCEYCGKSILIGTPHTMHHFYPEFYAYPTHKECSEEFKKIVKLIINMKTFIIESFASNQGNTVYTRNTETGFYDSPNNESKGLMDFLCLNNYHIKSITRQERNHITITVGVSRVENGRIVSKIKIVKGKVIIFDSVDDEYPLYSLNLFSEPKKESMSVSTTTVKNTMKSNKFSDLQNKIEKEYSREIRLEKTLRSRSESLEEFLVKFFTKWNNEKNIVFVDSPTQVQTSTGRRRSLGDIFMICKYYYSDCNLEEVLRLIYLVLPTKYGMISSICSQIHKRVWRFEGEIKGSKNYSGKDEYGNEPTYYINLLK